MKLLDTILGALFVFGLVIWGTVKAGKTTNTNHTRVTYTTMRCPTCGADARVYGSTWECGWCGDFGRCVRK